MHVAPAKATWVTTTSAAAAAVRGSTVLCQIHVYAIQSIFHGSCSALQGAPARVPRQRSAAF